MKQAILQQQWRPPCHHCFPQSLSQFQFSQPSNVSFSTKSKPPYHPLVGVTTLTLNCLNLENVEENADDSELPARERRKLRNQRRQSSKGIGWREEVEDRLIKKPKKKLPSGAEQLNLDSLADLGPQWYVVRASRVLLPYTAERLASSLPKRYPDMEFKVYVPAVDERRKLKNGSISVKPKPIYPGCVFLRCVLNKEMHDFIREIDGVGGFLGFRAGNHKRQINRPRPVSEDDMKSIFKQAKEEQKKADKEFEEKMAEDNNALASEKLNSLDTVDSNKSVDVPPVKEPKTTKRRSKKGSHATMVLKDRFDNVLAPGSTVKVLAGAFADFSGTLKKLDRGDMKATVGFTLLGKETIADVDISDIVAEGE